MKSNNRIMVNLDDTLCYRLQKLHGWRKGSYSDKINAIVEAALDLSDNLLTEDDDKFKAVQVAFIAATSAKGSLYRLPSIPDIVPMPKVEIVSREGDEVAF